MLPKVRNVERIQKALQAIQKLSQQQINTLSKQENLNELRLARLQNLKYQFNLNPSQEYKGNEQQENGNESNLNEHNSVGQVGVRWEILKEVPIVSYKQSQRQYEKQFDKTINELRVNVRKEEEKRINQQQQTQIKSTNGPQNKNNHMFSAVFSNQTGPSIFGELKQNNTFKSSLISNVLQSNEGNSIFGKKLEGSIFSKPKNDTIKPTQIIQEKPKVSLFNNQSKNENKPVVQAQKTSTTGYVPSLNLPIQGSSSVFGKRLEMEVPEVLPPPPITQGASLFSQSNPLVGVKTTTNQPNFSLFSNNNPSTAAAQSTSLFSNNKTETKSQANQQKNKSKEQSQLSQIQFKATLFQNTNPLPKEIQAKPTPSIFGTKVANTSIFSQSNNTSLFQKSTEPEKQKKIQQIPAQNKTMKISNQPEVKPSQQKPKQPTSIFDNPSTLTNPALNIFGTVTAQKPNENSNLFKNSLVLPNKNLPALFSFSSNSQPTPASTQPKQTAPSYQSGSLFSNHFRQPEKKQTTEPKIQEKKQESNLSYNIFGNLKPEPTSLIVQKPLNSNIATNSTIFGGKNTTGIVFGNLTNSNTNKSSVFSAKIQSLSAPQAPKQAPVPSPVPSVEPKKQQTEVVDSSQQSSSNANKKKTSQIFNEFMKSKPGGIFSKDNNTTGSSLFGGSAGGNLFGSLPPSTGNIFSSSGGQSLFGAQSKPQFTNSLFSNQQQNNEEQEQGDDGQGSGDDDVGVDKEQINPAQSTGNYKYQESAVLYKDTVPKFKRGQQGMLENVIISIEKIGSNQNYNFNVRLANKTIYFVGTILPGTTEVTKIKDNQYRNLCVKKILYIEDTKKALDALKIQFKDQKQGQAFFDKFNQACVKAS